MRNQYLPKATRLALAAALLSSVLSAHAGLVIGVTATTDMGSGFTTDLANTVNGVGLRSLALNVVHDETLPSNSWVSSVGTLTGTITFDLGGLYALSGFSFWNQNGGGPGAAGSTGLAGVDVLHSADGAIYNIWFFDTFTQIPDTSFGPEVFNPVGVDARFVRFNVLGNWGDAEQSGFAEVQFDGTAIPEPATLALVGLALAGLGLARRRT